MLDCFVWGLKPAVQHEVLKDNLTTFSDTFMIANRIGLLDNYLGEMNPFAYIHPQFNRKCNSMEYNDPKSYAPMELYAEFAR